MQIFCMVGMMKDGSIVSHFCGIPDCELLLIKNETCIPLVSMEFTGVA